jgi:5'-nucleotidase
MVAHLIGICRRFCTKLFLSAYREDVAAALDAGVPAALVYAPPQNLLEPDTEVRIAFDGDAVLFSDDSEKVYEQKGLEGFQQHELKYKDLPLTPGPFKPFLDALAAIQARFDERSCPIRTALVTARNAPAHHRPIKTLRDWKIRLDESFFLGGVEKSAVLEVFKPHIFFDDQEAHLKRPSAFIPVAQVLRKKTGA